MLKLTVRMDWKVGVRGLRLNCSTVNGQPTTELFLTISFLNLVILRARVRIPKRMRARAWGHRISMPMPRNSIPRTIMAKYRMGIR